ncbi:MAG: hypothetical protein V9H69_05090 [Anaerolineae bacterium]
MSRAKNGECGDCPLFLTVTATNPAGISAGTVKAVSETSTVTAGMGTGVGVGGAAGVLHAATIRAAPATSASFQPAVL